MKDVTEIRSSLLNIPYATEDGIRPYPPRFPGSVLKSNRSDVFEIVEGERGGVDIIDTERLFGELDERTTAKGIEALAWYHPFHLSSEEWGIYLPLSSVHYGANRWFDPRMALSRRIELAAKVLLSHEIIHYVCEYLVAQFEILLQACCWAPARERLKHARLDWLDDEEALANAQGCSTLSIEFQG
ncbi:MAG: hypothetical protein ACLPSW_29605 [Roseiarcus sp.]